MTTEQEDKTIKNSSGIITVVIALISALGAIGAAYVSTNASKVATKQAEIVTNTSFQVAPQYEPCAVTPVCIYQAKEDGFLVVQTKVSLGEDNWATVSTGTSDSNMKEVASTSASHRANSVLVSSNSLTLPISKSTYFKIEAKTINPGSEVVEGAVKALFFPVKISLSDE